ncbi:NADH-ubiquinone oxidoreductase-F iron-sulfur binding region domain-containing protein [uncultured Marinobacter sp.]|uniref:formate dehydrogenase beta subunit n=1 Tax=uncultured Marinobacter sp. TaxID=187379 RepID=UPI0030D8BE24
MTTTIYVPCDTTALSLGADRVAQELLLAAAAQNLDVNLMRNGSRGLFWLEPLIEVQTPYGRVAYGPVEPDQVEELVVAGLFEGHPDHPLYLGDIAQHPYLQQQQRLTFARIGITDPICIEDYIAHGGFAGLKKAAALAPQGIVDEVKASGLRGRGGAAFPAGIKWQTVLDEPQNQQKYVVCNADEGDSGTFADRLVMECDPYMLIEGMAIAGLAVGATLGFIYVRSEYLLSKKMLDEAIRTAEAHGYLGDNVCGNGRSFRLEARLGAGAYICGEETSLLESLEGKRGLVRSKPPLPAIKGLFGQPTVVNNVLSLAAVPYILAHGGKAYADYGMGRSLGTLPIQLAGNIKQGGLIELAFGVTLRKILEDFGAGTFTGRPMKAVQVGGPLMAYMPENQWDTPMDYEAFAKLGAGVGHGGVVVFDDTVDMGEQAHFAMEFCAVESCGKCTPCRIGSVRGVEVIDRIRAGDNRDNNLVLLEELCETMVDGSLCAMGGMTPFPVQSVMKHFPEDLMASPRPVEA